MKTIAILTIINALFIFSSCQKNDNENLELMEQTLNFEDEALEQRKQIDEERRKKSAESLEKTKRNIRPVDFSFGEADKEEG